MGDETEFLLSLSFMFKALCSLYFFHLKGKKINPDILIEGNFDLNDKPKFNF